LVGNIMIVPKPDLTMTAVSGPSIGSRGESIVISNTVANAGAGPASYFRIGYYLSTDAIITTSDIFIGERNLNSGLAGGASSQANSTITISSSMAYGTYYLGAIADHNGWVDEDDENNNSLAGNLINISN